MEKWMVWDTYSGDKIFHKSEQSARNDYKEAISMINEESSIGEFSVYLFELKEQKDIETPLES